MPLGLIALAMGGFGIGLTEFVIMGLLPEVSADFEVTESVAGYLISGYALSVAIGAILLTAAVIRFERKKVLLSLMVLFIIGNLMSALAPTYEMMMGGRVIAALCHGAFFGIGSVLAADEQHHQRLEHAFAVEAGDGCGDDDRPDGDGEGVAGDEVAGHRLAYLEIGRHLRQQSHDDEFGETDPEAAHCEGEQTQWHCSHSFRTDWEIRALARIPRLH